MLDYNAKSFHAILSERRTWRDPFTGTEHTSEASVSYRVQHLCGCHSIVSSEFNVICIAPCKEHEGRF